MAVNKTDTRDLKRLKKHMKLLFKRIGNTQDIMAEIAFYLDKEAKDALHGSRSGRLYKAVKRPRVSDPRWKRREKDHRASAEGEAPAFDTGDLRKSIAYNSDKRSAVVGSPLKYSAILENPDQLNRPWLRTINDNSVPAIQKIIRRHLMRATK